MKTFEPHELIDHQVEVRSAPSAFVEEGKAGPASSGDRVLINTPDGQIPATHFPKRNKVVVESDEDRATLERLIPRGRRQP